MKPSLRLRTYIALLASLTVAGAHLHGQAASAGTTPAQTKPRDMRLEKTSVEEDEPITLSVFEVTATDDTGYLAATSLAGNRLNTELKDVGSAITVVTEKLMRDIGAVSNETLLQYTTNTEVGNIYGNMSNAGGGTQLDETSKFSNPNQNTRVRGLASADTTIDYFLTDMPWDGYNTDRVDFQRGPNAILFGLGSPAGIINAGTKVAGFKNKGSAEVRYSRFGSVRSTLDCNYVLLPKQLSFRLDALLNKEKFQQKPAFQDDKRLFGTVRYEPAFLNKSGFAKTTIKANFEQGNIRSNRPRSLTPNDGITPWFLTGTSVGYRDKVVGPGGVVLSSGVPFDYNNLNRKGFDARGLQDTDIASIGADGRGQFVKAVNNSGGLTAGELNKYWQPWLGGGFSMNYFGNPMAIYANGDSAANTIVNWYPTTNRGISSTGAIDKNIRGIPASAMSSVTLYRDVSKKVNLPGAVFGLTRNLTLSDPSIFDFYNQLIDGPNKKEWSNFKRYNVNLAQTFLNGDAGMELVLDKQHYDNGQRIFMSDKGQALFIDVIQTMIDGSTNPNFGRPYIGSNAAGANHNDYDRMAFRATTYFKHDFTKGRKSNFLLRALGKHTLTGLYATDEYKTGGYGQVVMTSDNAYKDFVNGYGSAPSNINSNQRQVYQTIYLGPSLANATSAVNAHIPNPTVQAVVSGGTSVKAFDSTWTATTVNPGDPWSNPLYPVGHKNNLSTQSENPANYRGWLQTPITITDVEMGNQDANTTSANLKKNVVESKAFNWQGYLFDGAFVGMFGYREDTARAWAVTATKDTEGRAILDRTVFKLPDSYLLVKGSSKSYSGVLHLNRLLNNHLPLDVSVFYNQSSNFQPLAGRVGALNNPLTAPTGDTKDYGIRLATKDGKYALKVNKYKTSVKNAKDSSGFNYWYFASLFTEFQPRRNQYKFEVSNAQDPTSYHSGEPSGYTYQPALGQTPDQAIAAMKADIEGWDNMMKSLPAGFFTTWKFNPNQTDISQLGPNQGNSITTPNGFSIIEDNVSTGMEYELSAQPVKGLNIAFNASKQEAVRTNVGDPTFNSLVNTINTALNTTSAGTLRMGTSGTAFTSLYQWNANFMASYLSVKAAEGAAVGELRKWRANMVASYEFQGGFLKGVSVGTACRWQDKIVIGYQPRYVIPGEVPVVTTPWLATAAQNDLSKPFYGPSEINFDLWVGYKRKISKNLNWRTQINVRNVGKHNSLIPINVQPDGTVASWRIAPTQIWSLTNSIEF